MVSQGNTESISENVSYRQGFAEDQALISSTLGKLRMNPFNVHPANFIVAEERPNEVDESKLGKDVVGFGQIRASGDTYELASLFVKDDWRKQGIGSSIVRQLLARHAAENGEDALNRTFLLVPENNMKFYSRLGFTEVPLESDSVPLLLKAEAKVGSIITNFMFGVGVKAMKASPSEKAV